METQTEELAPMLEGLAETKEEEPFTHIRPVTPHCYCDTCQGADFNTKMPGWTPTKKDENLILYKVEVASVCCGTRNEVVQFKTSVPNSEIVFQCGECGLDERLHIPKKTMTSQVVDFIESIKDK